MASLHFNILWNIKLTIKLWRFLFFSRRRRLRLVSEWPGQHSQFLWHFFPSPLNIYWVSYVRVGYEDANRWSEMNWRPDRDRTSTSVSIWSNQNLPVTTLRQPILPHAHAPKNIINLIWLLDWLIQSIALRRPFMKNYLFCLILQ